MSTITELATERVRQLTPYLSARRIGGKGHNFLNANEAPKSATFLMKSITLNRYPECQPPEVIEAYADYSGVAEENILVSRGSDESIGLLVRTYCEPGKDAILISTPTYGMYSISADTAGVKTVDVPPADDFQPDVEAIRNTVENGSDNIKVIFICSPNNPTGNVVDDEKLTQILEFTKGRCLVVVDEAYIEFCPEATKVKFMKDYDHLVITRTLSKAFALAGIRCGFTLANPEVIKLMLKVIDPYPIADPVAQIAVQALSTHGIAIMKERVAELKERRDRFVEEVKKLDFVQEVFYENANYILIRFKDGEALFKACADKGIILRDFHTKTRLQNCVRITIGSEEEMNEVLSVFHSIKQ